MRLTFAVDTLEPRLDLRFPIGGDVEAAFKCDWRLLARAARLEQAFELLHPDWLFDALRHL
jgi:hypothetical protein